MHENNTAARFLTGSLVILALALVAIVGVPALLLTVLLPSSSASCTPASGALGVQKVNVPAGLGKLARQLWDQPLHMQPGRWYPVGATEYQAGPGTGDYGSIPDPQQANLEEHPHTFAELSLEPVNKANACAGCFTFQDANALGVLPYMTALRVVHEGNSIVVYKRDIGYGQGPSEHTPEGFQYRIDLWGPAAAAIGVTKDQVDIELAPPTGAGEVLEATPSANIAEGPSEPAEGTAGCEGEASVQGPLPLTAGQSAKVLGDGLAAAPKEAPAPVQAMVAAGNELFGKPYVYGGAHGPPLSALQPGYDCSSAVSFVLHAGGVFGDYAEDSTELESYGQPGPGRWVSVYANSQHAFMYVAGLRFDTSYKGTDVGPNEGKSGPRWRVLDHVPNWAQWVVRHPPGL